MTARALVIALACALLPASPAQAEVRPAPRSAITLLVRPAVILVRAVREVGPTHARADERVVSPTTLGAPRSWPKVRQRLYVWWRALLW